MESASLSQQVYDELHRRLRSGELRPGTQLVNRTLAAELGTSTIPVREAIHRMASEGLLELAPGAGAFVRLPQPSELGDLYDVREALEALAAAQAAKYADDHLLAELQGICARFREIASAIGRGKHATSAQFQKWLEAEEQFHTRVVAAARNRWLSKVVRDVRVISHVFAAQKSVAALLTQTVAKQTLRQHETFLEILARHDVDEAKRWMTEHIRSGRALVLKQVAVQQS
ncbi:MAG TPA: GntR family transcriptional regulator [Pirellulaceae bacterium]|nr:GntR family transcriptional regulator [Pirellulaceae bacterium]